jgi:predicted ester cyclase
LQKEFLKSFPDQRVTIETLVAEGDYVAGYATYTGTQEGPMPPFPASGKKVESKFLSLFRLEEGKIAELWVEWDNLAMLKQLGHFPPPTISEK